MLRRAAAVCCLVAAVGVLLGVGWALLALGLLLLVGVPATSDATLVVGVDRLRVGLGGLVARARALPRRSVAVGGMGAGLLAVPLGLVFAAGAGVAVVAFGGLAIAVSLLSGWNA